MFTGTDAMYLHIRALNALQGDDNICEIKHLYRSLHTRTQSYYDTKKMLLRSKLSWKGFSKPWIRDASKSYVKAKT